MPDSPQPQNPRPWLQVDASLPGQPFTLSFGSDSGSCTAAAQGAGSSGCCKRSIRREARRPGQARPGRRGRVSLSAGSALWLACVARCRCLVLPPAKAYVPKLCPLQPLSPAFLNCLRKARRGWKRKPEPCSELILTGMTDDGWRRFFSPLFTVMLENQKTSAVNFMISHPGLSHIFLQESPTFQTSSEHFSLSFVGIRKKEGKQN